MKLTILFFLPALCYAEPVVNLGSGNTIVSGGTIFNQEYFRGIPFARSPIGDLRFQPPQLKIRLDVPNFDATSFGPACLQPPSPLTPDELSEDCLALNIQRPAGTNETSRLPVLIWVFGGAFAGKIDPVSMSTCEQSAQLVVRPHIFLPPLLLVACIGQGSPTIHVSLNYRLSALGFPSGNLASELGILNLGLKDQLTALEWINQNIVEFGGDPQKILESGASAGASYYPSLREASFKASLACLQSVDAETLRTVISALSPTDVSFGPELDGPKGIVPDYPSRLLDRGEFVRLPTLLGTNLDENTIFTPTDVNSTEYIKQYIHTFYDGPSPTTDEVVEQLLDLYPDIPALGSPYGTGNETFGLSSQYKRMASLVGDLAFTAPARRIARIFSKSGIKTYGYLFTERRPENPPNLGVVHGDEVYFVYGVPSAQPIPEATQQLSIIMMDYWLSFASSLDPNDGQGSSRSEWPAYTPDSPCLLRLDGSQLEPIIDDFRYEGIEYIMDNSNALGF
ncbi:hypothetical protein ONZ45_g313 [Pleurotus djamor]|nr:hypothetical protein ONZ45_g313 [Pleurotus djamor]